MPACAAAPRTSRTDDPKAPALFVGGAGGQAQARTRMSHNQTRAVSYTVEAFGNKSCHIRSSAASFMVEIATSPCASIANAEPRRQLSQDVQFGIAIHDLPLSAATCNRRRSHDRVFQN